MPQYIMPNKENPAFQELDEFTQAYIECALWTEEERLAEESESLEMSATAFKTVNGKFTGETVFVPGNIGFDLLAPETLQRMIDDCKRFRDDAKIMALIAGNESQAGHDFWLTRNGHGAGFWDRGLGDIGDVLTERTHCFPEVSLYLGDNGKVYMS